MRVPLYLNVADRNRDDTGGFSVSTVMNANMNLRWDYCIQRFVQLSVSPGI